MLRIASDAQAAAREAAAPRLIAALHAERPMLGELLDQAMIHPLAIEWAPLGALEINPRSGKLRRVIDRRHEQR